MVRLVSPLRFGSPVALWNAPSPMVVRFVSPLRFGWPVFLKKA